MGQNNNRQNNGQNNNAAGGRGWKISDIVRDLAVAWQLMRDPQVSALLKMSLPLFALLYWISPIDLLTGMPFDDIAVIIVASRLFVQFAPQEAVERALVRLGRISHGASFRQGVDQPDREIWNIWEDDEDENTISGDWQVVDDS